MGCGASNNNKVEATLEIPGVSESNVVLEWVSERKCQNYHW